MKENKTQRVNKKHFILFNNNGVISATTPKDWARANQHFFPKHNFLDSKNTPRDTEIEKYLSNKLNYNCVSNTEIIIYYPYTNL